MTNAGEVGSHAVYPRASKVARSPPDGKEDASGSPLTSALGEKSSTISPLPVGSMNASCLPAEILLSGWNQWV